MPEAVIFDFYGTLAHWADTAASYTTVFSSFGYEPAPSVFDGYFSRYDGVDHAEHSVSEEAYEAWVRWRLGELSAACGVSDPRPAAAPAPSANGGMKDGAGPRASRPARRC